MTDLRISNVDRDWALNNPTEPMGRLARRRIIDAHNALVDWVMAGEERPVAVAWPCDLGGGECYCVPLCGTPKPAAPTPVRCDECDPSFGCFNGSAPCSKQPAAPEPSAEPAGCCEGRADLVSRLMRAEDRVIAVQQIGIDAMKRAESAEAQLAAVTADVKMLADMLKREAEAGAKCNDERKLAVALLVQVRATIDRVMAEDDEESGAVGLAEELDGIVPALTPAPSPGAGGTT